MFEFNSTHIFTGYIKELLAEFNLPKYKVYVEDENVPIFETTPDGEHARYIPYIKDNKVQKYVDGKWETISPVYNFNEPIINATINLPLKNNIYDSETHEYLGEFLRFIRDYKNINLMPLYNCFSDKICTNAKIDINPNSETEKLYEFNSYDNRYKIFMLPVKLFKEYTIAIDCTQPVEMCCMIYGSYLNQSDKFKELAGKTYQKFNSMKFNSPVLYKKLTSDTIKDLIKKDNDMELAQNEQDLKLFIKLPITNSSSITILEGNYLNYNDRILKRNKVTDATWTNQSNHFITNFEDFDSHKFFFKPITNLQLLQMNTQISYPFADRLIEYLIGQAITEEDTIYDNVTRFQKIYEQNVRRYKAEGIWEEIYRPVIYEFINKFKNNININHDILGYADKEAEKYYVGPKKDIEGNRDMFANIDIYPEETEMVESRAQNNG